jgi:hypothetical protein
MNMEKKILYAKTISFIILIISGAFIMAEQTDKLLPLEKIRVFKNKGGGKDKIWGDSNIPGLISSKGKLIFEDSFENLNNWHHEGRGSLTQPLKNILQLNCVNSMQGKAGCMAFCKKNFPDNIRIEYDLRVVTSKGLVITFIATEGRKGEDIIDGLPERKGIFADYVLSPYLRCYHVSVSRYNDKGEHTDASNWRRNPDMFLMAQQKDLCEKINTWYRIVIIKKGVLLQMAVDGKLAGGFIDPDEIPEPVPSSGKIGFRAIGSEVIAQIKNFRVFSLE